MRYFSFLSDLRPPLIFPFTLLSWLSQFNPSSTTTPSDFVFATRFISESLRFSGSETSTSLILRGWPIIMYSVFLGLALSLFTLIHSEIFLNSLWAFVIKSSTLLDVKVTWIFLLLHSPHYTFVPCVVCVAYCVSSKKTTSYALIFVAIS